MKYFLSILLVLFLNTAESQQHSLVKLWETDTVLAIPESVLLLEENQMFVSLIDGGSWNADGKGGVGRILSDGKEYNASWVTGLNAPKGMGVFNNKLYVADLSEVVMIDIREGKIVKRISIPGASGLNDVTVSESGSVYVSDSRTGKIWKIDKEAPALFMDSVEGVNGLKAVGDDLIVAAGKNLIRVGSNREITKIAELSHGGDGIEPVGNGDYLVSSWSGYLFYVSADGKVETLLNTSTQKKNAADIGYDPEKKIVYVPTFNSKTIVAYRVMRKEGE